MTGKRIIYCILIFLSCCLLTHAQNKRALLIGISQYGNNTGWKNIHGANDVDLMKSVLNGFSIRELKNANATYDNIIKELNYLTKKTKEGDIVYIHFSGHGQPFEDINGDEQDGWDESFIPFDAHLYYEQNVYSGNKHLTDDILNTYLIKIRKKNWRTWNTIRYYRCLSCRKFISRIRRRHLQRHRKRVF